MQGKARLFKNTKLQVAQCAYAFVILAAAIQSGCSSEQTNPDVVDGQPMEQFRQATQQIETLDIGELEFRWSVDGLIQSSDVALQETSTQVSLTAGLLGESSTVSIEYYLEVIGLPEIPLATLEGIPRLDLNTNTYVLNGSDIVYIDTDGDSLANLHEVVFQPFDVDDDGQANYEDRDSDADSVDDNLDPTPYGGTPTSLAQPTLSFLAQPIEGTTTSIRVNTVIGAADLPDALPIAGATVPIELPAGWPWTGSNIMQDENWTAFVLPGLENRICQFWQIPYDVSSMLLTTSAGLLGYFRRFDGTGFLVPLGSGQVRDLARFSRTALTDGNPSLDDALRAILVPSGHLGWVTLRSAPELTGDVCQLNLGTLPTAF